jgi:hypothetical protein
MYRREAASGDGTAGKTQNTDYFFEGCQQVKNICPTPAKISKALNGRGNVTILRVSIIAFPAPICTSCFFAGMLICGHSKAAIPLTISKTPTIAIG